MVDSENVSIGQQLLTLYAVRIRDKGLSCAEIVRELETRRGDIRVLALLDTLEYLKKGGSFSSSVTFIGELLSIKPVVAVQNGEIVLVETGFVKGIFCAENGTGIRLCCIVVSLCSFFAA